MSDQPWKDDVLDTPSSRCVNLTTLYPKKGVALKDFEQNWFLFSLLCTCLMCFNGGFVNAICFAGPWHAGLTHVTGSVTLSGTRVAVAAKPGQYAYWEYLSFVFSFGFGGAFAGFVIGDPWRRWGRVQASLCICQGLLLILAEYVYTQNVSLTLSAIIISFAMGIQNTISSMYAPMTIRTSHVSGTVLDIGMTIGSMIRTRSLDNLWKIKVHAPSLFSYWLGAVIGCFTYVAWAERALYVNATATIAFGVLTFIMFRTPVCYFEDPALVALNLEQQQQKEEQGLFSPSVLSPLSPRYQSGYGSVPEPLIDYTRDDVVEKLRFDKFDKY